MLRTRVAITAFLSSILLITLIPGVMYAVFVSRPTAAQAAETPRRSDPARSDLSQAPANVDVKPVAHDEEIRNRLQRVLNATNWFKDPHVRVEQGVVFLNGQTSMSELKKWAGDLARNTQDVVAVVNQIDVTAPSLWDLGPAWSGLLTLWRESLRSLPFLLLGLIILVLSLGAGILTTRAARSFLRERVAGALIRNVIARIAGALIFLLGLNIVLRISGLTQLALTVVGSTGLIGLAVGIAFRDITENFLARCSSACSAPSRRATWSRSLA